MKEPSAVQEEVQRIKLKAAEAGSDRESILSVLTEAIELHEPVEVWRATQRDLVEKAFLAGAQPQDLRGITPYSEAYLRMLYNELRKNGAELPALVRGPRKRPRE